MMTATSILSIQPPGGGPILALNRDRKGRLLIATGNGLFRHDEGWTNLFASIETAEILTPTALHVTPDGTILVGVVGGVLQSSDHGVTWTVHRFSAPAPTIASLATIPGSGIVLAGTLEDGVFHSDDGGATWTSWNFGLFDRSALQLATIGPVGDLVVAASETGCFLSVNTGKSWVDLPLPDGIAISALAGSGDALLLGTPGGRLYRWAEGDDWVPLPKGQGGAAIIGIQVLPSGHLVAVDETGQVTVFDLQGNEMQRMGTAVPAGEIVVTALAWLEREALHLALGGTGPSIMQIGPIRLE